MNISATIRNAYQSNQISVATNGSEKQINIASKTEGYGSGINGGEFLLLALATCFCNDIYREAVKFKMEVEAVEVNVVGRFGAEGEPASDIQYEVKVHAPAHSRQEIAALIHHVDKLAEVHNTLRKGIEVRLKDG
ncbi:MAG TPA: OsmC family protein [Flavisolibacter sp.]|jgi:uncharacterized OsmC-like protein|nr:OsmC family protein [Flavisolibacter sp.]